MAFARFRSHRMASPAAPCLPEPVAPNTPWRASRSPFLKKLCAGVAITLVASPINQLIAKWGVFSPGNTATGSVTLTMVGGSQQENTAYVRLTAGSIPPDQFVLLWQAPRTSGGYGDWSRAHPIAVLGPSTGSRDEVRPFRISAPPNESGGTVLSACLMPVSEMTEVDHLIGPPPADGALPSPASIDLTRLAGRADCPVSGMVHLEPK